MRIEVDVSMVYDLGEPRLVGLAIEPAAAQGQFVILDSLFLPNAWLGFASGCDGVGRRIWANVRSAEFRLDYRAMVEVTRFEPWLATLPATPLQDLPGDVYTYLRPSRYCESDAFASFAAKRFGQLEYGSPMVVAIRDWVAREITYRSGASGLSTTALDTFTSREGVCRDFTHMVCALCRAVQIPARYASVYAPGVNPPDFHAVAQVWLNGSWHIVDATGMCSETSAVVIAVGRDACDVAFMESSGPVTLVSQHVYVRYA